jgi:hypothetical protein
MDTEVVLYTVGGYPASEARVWDKCSYQELGEIIHLLSKGLKESRRKAVGKYFEMRRYFIKEVFEDYVDALDQMRVEKGFPKVRDEIDAVRHELIKYGSPTDMSPKPEYLPLQSDIPMRIAVPSVRKIEKVKPINAECEQISLF